MDGDIGKTCKGCGANFTLTASEVLFYTDPGRGLTLPARCPACRAARKAERQAAEASGAAASTPLPPRERRTSQRGAFSETRMS